MGSRGQSGEAINLFQAPQNVSFSFHFDDVKLAELSNHSFEFKNWHI